ncbi:hypothetical protein M0R45_012984 [Rubus argutus]|uniref:Uncharacterized protein n=1 Tax=Rubus argutus TaxID=59490 RepID=A0AAW1XI74_RUBAR
MSETKECCYLCVLKFLLPLGFLALLLWLCLIPKPPRYTIVDFTIPKSDLDIDGLRKDTVGENTMAAFHQGRRRTLRVVDHVEVVNQHLRMAICVSILNGTAELKVALRTRIQYGTWGIKSNHHGVHLQAALPIGADGKISGKKKKIKLRRHFK